MKMREKRQALWSIVAILMIIFPYILSMASVLPQKVEAVTTGEVIFDQEDMGRVEVSYQEKETTIEWQIDYQKYEDASNEYDSQRLLKLKLDTVSDIDSGLKDTASMQLQADGWLAESTYSTTSKGKILLEVPKEENTLAVEIQLDERRTAISENDPAELEALVEEDSQDIPELQLTDILPAEMQGPYQVTAQVDTVEETQATEAENENDQEESVDAAASLPSRATRNITRSSEFPDIRSTKRAQLATKDAAGNPLSPLEAWNQRLYEITFDLTATAPLLHGEADIVFIVDVSGSTSGGDRAADIKAAITFLEKELEGTGATINIAILPASGKFEPNNNTQDIKLDFASLEEWTFKENADAKSLFEDQFDKINEKNYGGNKNAIVTNEYINEELLPGRNNHAFVVYAVGTTINDPKAVGEYVKDADHLSPENTFVAQSENMDNAWLSNGVTIAENYFHNNNVGEGDIVKAMVDALVRKLRINNLQLTDELSQYFEIVAIPDSEEDGPKFSIANDGKTFNVTDIELNSNDPAEGEEAYYSWSTTILVKAEDAFVGADEVPTNIGASSGIKIPEMETMQPFETVDGEGREYDLATPYVDVKLHAPIPIETNETILLNQAAKGIVEITEGWHEKIWKSEHDHKDIEHNHELKEDFHKDHKPHPQKDETYESEHTIKAGVASEEMAAAEYVANYGTKELEDLEDPKSDAYPRSNQHVRSVVHNVQVLTTKLTIDKKLDGEKLLDDFKATFNLEIVETDEPIKPIYSEERTLPDEDLEFEELGVGTYELSEQLASELDGIKIAGPWEIVVSEKAKQDPEELPTFELSIGDQKIVATEDGFLLELNNESKELAVDVLKLDEHSQAPISGVTFEIHDSANTLIAKGTTDDDGKLIFEAEPEFKVNETYTLTETSVPNDYVMLSDKIEFTIDSTGTLNAFKGEDTYSLVSKKDSEDINALLFEITVLNRPKGQLPTTGGEGRRMFMIIAAILLVCAMGTSVYYVYRNRRGQSK
ncbi:MSCRAMM family protein [Enterococcus xiangfangensis]|nr:prealbumin-like fold domain-containing protein [Enterococcus xiangfangensis]